MKVKEVNVTASIGWSPAAIGAPQLVCATAAQHADPASKNNAIQVYSLNLKEENLSMKLSGSLNTNTRFHDVAWGVGGTTVAGDAGVVACAGDDGGIYVYNGHQLMTGGSEPLMVSMEGKHAGPALTLDFNHHQPNLLVSGSRDCEVFIWDINDPQVPMSPGTKATLQADVTSVAWNRQVEHILASVYAGRCVVFDLRKSASIIQIAEAVSRVKATTVCWHPTVATQLAIASSDDTTPLCQIWDLRFASAPVKQLEGHQRGIQSIAWCDKDPDLLCTAAKDNRMFCWSPSSGEIICEFPSYNQWSYEVRWCPRDPALIATASVDGTASVYSLLGAGYAPPKDVKFSAIADSFPGMEMPAEVPAAAQPQYIYLKRPPAFLASKGGCSFGFGGRLLSWNNQSRVVEINQVVTEPELVERSNQLLNALHGTSLQSYCSEKLNLLPEGDKDMWKYISASLELDETGQSSSRLQYLSLLGHPQPTTPTTVEDSSSLAAQLGGLATADGSTDSLDPSEQFEMIASAQACDKTPEPELLDADSPRPGSASQRSVVVSTDGAGGSVRKAVIEGRLEAAVDLCIQEEKCALALILAQHAGPELYQKTRDRVLLLASDGDDVYGVVSAVVKADLDSVASQIDLGDWKQAVVAVTTHSPDQLQLSRLLQVLGGRLEAATRLQAALVCYVIAGAMDSFVSCWVKTKPGRGSLSTHHLLELVEIILVMSPNNNNSLGDGKEGSAVAVYLGQYASLLATQGALTTALHYLVNNSAAETQSELVALKDRVSGALGYTSAPAAASGGTRPEDRNRTISTTSNTSHHQLPQPSYRRTTNTSTAAVTQQPQQFTPSVQARQSAAFVAPPLNTFAPPLPPPTAAVLGGAPQTPYFQPQQPQQTAQQFAPTQQQYGFAPPPPMGGAAAAQAPPPSMGGPTMGAPAATISAPGGLRRGGGGVNRYITCNTPPFGGGAAPIGGGQQPGMMYHSPPGTNQPIQPPATFQPQPIANTLTNAVPSTNIQQPQQANFLNPAAVAPPSSLPGGGLAFDPSLHTPHQAVDASKPPAAYDATVPRGWNDPPPMSSARKAKQQQQHQSTPAVEAVNAMVPTQQPVQQPQQTGFQGFQGFQPQGPPSNFGAPQPPPAGLGAPPLNQPPKPATPLPMPAEAQPVYNVLNALYTKALHTAPNMMMKQTFEAVGPKLEALYDKLRTGQVSPGTLSGLQSLCQCVQASDYHRALQTHAQTVAAGNFAEMALFMPAIKKLLATCMQCQIYLS